MLCYGLLDWGFQVDHFGRYLAWKTNFLKKRGFLENNLVVLTVEKGMPLTRAKSQEYELSNHLPLAVMWKKGIKIRGR